MEYPMTLNLLNYITVKKISPINESQCWTAELDFHYHDGSVHKRKVIIHGQSEAELDFLCKHIIMVETTVSIAMSLKEEV